MRIAIMTALFIPKWLGGTEIATSKVAKLLVSKGHEVHLVTSRDEGLPEESVSEGVFVHRIPWKKGNFFGNRIFELRMLRMLWKVRPQIVHVQSIQFSECACALFAKFLFQVPYVIYARGSDVYVALSIRSAVLMSRILLKHANAVVALTKDMKRRIQQVYMRDVTVVPNGVDADKFEGLSKHEARTMLQIDDDTNIVTFVGSLREVKGVEYLIRATKLILQKGTVVHTLIIGDGPDRDRLEYLTHQLQINNYVTFEGQIQNEQVPYYLIASDIFVLPSLSEGFPNVLLEAMASGLPIVATNVGGVPEFVKDRENGFITEPQNAKEISERALFLLRNEEITNRISHNNKLKAREFSWELVTDRLEEVYSSCL